MLQCIAEAMVLLSLESHAPHLCNLVGTLTASSEFRLTNNERTHKLADEDTKINWQYVNTLMVEHVEMLGTLIYKVSNSFVSYKPKLILASRIIRPTQRCTTSFWTQLKSQQH